MRRNRKYNLEKINSFDEDVVFLKRYLVSKGYSEVMSYADVRDAWMDFSQTYDASWLSIHEYTLEQFLDWLDEEDISEFEEDYYR